MPTPQEIANLIRALIRRGATTVTGVTRGGVGIIPIQPDIQGGPTRASTGGGYVPAGACVCYLTDQGWVVVGGQAQLIRTSLYERKYRAPQPVEDSALVVPTLFYRDNGSVREIWLGGDRSPTKLTEYPYDIGVTTEYLSAVKGKRFVAVGFPVCSIAGWTQSGTNSTITTPAVWSDTSSVMGTCQGSLSYASVISGLGSWNGGPFTRSYGTTYSVGFPGDAIERNVTVEIVGGSIKLEAPQYSYWAFSISIGSGGSVGFYKPSVLSVSQTSLESIYQVSPGGKTFTLPITADQLIDGPLHSTAGSYSGAKQVSGANLNIILNATYSTNSLFSRFGFPPPGEPFTGPVITATIQFRVRFRDIGVIRYITIDGNNVTMTDTVRPNPVTTSEEDWRRTIATYGNPLPATDPCIGSFRSYPYTNLYRGDLYSIDEEQAVGGGPLYETIKTGNRTAKITIAPTTAGSGSCSVGAAKEGTATIKSIVSGTVLSMAPVPKG